MAGAAAGCIPGITTPEEALPSVERIFYEAPVGRISALRAGDPGCPRVIFIHGTPGNAIRWAPYLRSAPAGWELLAVDRPGFGQSEPVDYLASLADQAAALEPLLVNVGDYPERVAGLVVIAGAVDPDLERIRWYNHLATPLEPALPRRLRNANREIRTLRTQLRILGARLDRVRSPRGDHPRAARPLGALRKRAVPQPASLSGFLGRDRRRRPSRSSSPLGRAGVRASGAGAPSLGRIGEGQDMRPPGTAFVLAGGGSLGAVQVGMLEALLEVGIVPDLIVGASVGAINGAYLAGRPDLAGARALDDIWRRLRRSDVFPLSAWGSLPRFLFRREHLVDPGALRRLLEHHLGYADLKGAAAPLHIVATDLLTGHEVVLASGPVVEAVLASAAIPSIFPAVKLGDRFLGDGAIANNTPISVAIAEGAERIIVLPTGFSCALEEPPRSWIGMALHALTLLIARRLVADIELYRGRIDLHVVPPLCPVKSTLVDFARSAQLIELALQSTRAWLRGGGLDRTEVPGSLRPHAHPAVDSLI